MTQLIKYEQYQLGFCIESGLCNGSTRGPRLLSKKGFMSLVPRARHKWSWRRRQQTYCQKPYSQGKGRTMEIKWQGRSKELNHPRGSAIPGFPMTPARGTGEDLEQIPVEVLLSVPTLWWKTCKITCGSSKNHGPYNLMSSCTLTFQSVSSVKTGLENNSIIALNSNLFNFFFL